MTAFARVLLTVEVEISNWSDAHTVGEITQKAKVEAVQEVRRYQRLGTSTPLKIVGEPEVTLLIQPEQKR